jgi:hypothetical protein
MLYIVLLVTLLAIICSTSHRKWRYMITPKWCFKLILSPPPNNSRSTLEQKVENKHWEDNSTVILNKNDQVSFKKERYMYFSFSWISLINMHPSKNYELPQVFYTYIYQEGRLIHYKSSEIWSYYKSGIEIDS